MELWQTSGRLQVKVAREIGIQPTMLRRIVAVALRARVRMARCHQPTGTIVE